MLSEYAGQSAGSAMLSRPSSRTTLQDVQRMTNEVLERLHTVRNRLVNVADRLGGPEPEGKLGGSGPTGPGMVEESAAVVRTSLQMLTDIDHQIDRLDGAL